MEKKKWFQNYKEWRFKPWNYFITKRGFNLYRGDIGSKVENQTKTEWQIKELNAELEELKQEKENVLRTIENSKNGLETANKSNDKDTLLNPTKRKLGGYKEEDVNIKEVEQVNIQENQVEEEESNFRGDLVEEDTDEYNEEIVWSDQNFKEE